MYHQINSFKFSFQSHIADLHRVRSFGLGFKKLGILQDILVLMFNVKT